MNIEIEIDDDLIAEAMRVSGITDLEELIRETLRALVGRKRRKSLLDLEGRIQFAPGYDYKSLR
jgi:Arc/MetJ family transcription regulator